MLSGLFVFACIPVLLFADTSSPQGEVDFVYLKYNIHAQDHRGGFTASYVNWTKPPRGHFVIPANTKVKIDPNYSGRRMLITEVNTKREIVFEYNAKHMGMSEEQYVKLITSPQPVSLDGFSELDKKGIAAGEAYVGMTRKGVMTALGYPATYLTSSIDNKIWTYCANRFNRILVEFDDSGIVKDVRDTKGGASN